MLRITISLFLTTLAFADVACPCSPTPIGTPVGACQCECANTAESCLDGLTFQVDLATCDTNGCSVSVAPSDPTMVQGIDVRGSPFVIQAALNITRYFGQDFTGVVLTGPLANSAFLELGVCGLMPLIDQAAVLFRVDGERYVHVSEDCPQEVNELGQGHEVSPGCFNFRVCHTSMFVVGYQKDRPSRGGPKDGKTGPKDGKPDPKGNFTKGFPKDPKDGKSDPINKPPSKGAKPSTASAQVAGGKSVAVGVGVGVGVTLATGAVALVVRRKIKKKKNHYNMAAIPQNETLTPAQMVV